MNELLADRPQQKARKAPAAAVADNDQRSVPGLYEQNFGRWAMRWRSTSTI
jgi:hypothetical protein